MSGPINLVRFGCRILIYRHWRALYVSRPAALYAILNVAVDHRDVVFTQERTWRWVDYAKAGTGRTGMYLLQLPVPVGSSQVQRRSADISRDCLARGAARRH
jgi:hypothetical protein